MNYLDAVLLGVVEGITEFLPVSSTGHLILASSLLNLHGEAVEAFEIIIQLGAILAVVFVYSQRFSMLFDFKSPKAFSGKRGLILLAVTSLPILIVGFLSQKLIHTYLMDNPMAVAAALIIGGVGIIAVEKMTHRQHTQNLDDIQPKQALNVGLFQCLALWPGMSRSASTIVGGLFTGLSRRVAVEYAFLAAVPIMLLVTVLDFIKHRAVLMEMQNLGPLLVGFVVSFIFAIVAIKCLLQFLQHRTLIGFGVYRILIGVATIAYFHFHPLVP